MNGYQDDPHASEVLKLFTIDKTLLFVGCGDTVLDPNFARLIEWGQEALRNVAPRHVLLCRKAELPAFREMLHNASWIQPVDYGDDYPELAPFLRELAPATIAAGPTSTGGPSPPPPPHAAPRLDLDGYRTAIQRQHGHLKLQTLDATANDLRPVLLSGVFVEPAVRECAEYLPRVFELPKEVQRRLREAGEQPRSAEDERWVEEYRRAYVGQSPRDASQVFDDPNYARLVVLGDPGSGKSTLLAHRLIDWAESPPGAGPERPVPILIELRDYARLRREGQVSSIFDFLARAESVRWHWDETALRAHLEREGGELLFDGLDEVFDKQLRREVSTAIHRLAQEFPRTRIVVTSRIFGYAHQDWRDESFRAVMLQELDEPRIGTFFERWHQAVYDTEAERQKYHDRLSGAIEHSSAIRQLAGNPLLLTMMALLNRTQELPRDRAELYEQCSRLLLHQWKADEAFVADPVLKNVSLDYKDKRGLLMGVAWAMQQGAGGLAANLIEEEPLEQTLAEGLAGFPAIGQAGAPQAARALIQQLRGRNFMLSALGGGAYAFVHRTFLEYFCAREIQRQFESAQSLTLEGLKTAIYVHWIDETWHEVLCLLAGILDPRVVAQILEWLLKQPDPDETCRHLFLAARCVGEVRRRGELRPVEGEVLRLVKALTTLEVARMYESQSKRRIFLFQIRERAVRLVATVWHNDLHTFDWLRTRAEEDGHHEVRRAAVHELARGWRDDSRTLPWLQDRAQGDKNRNVRQAAIQELARDWRDDPQTPIIVKDRAQRDDDGNVRTAAVEALARGWHDDPETLNILRDRAQRDVVSNVRAAAVEELARGWHDDPETHNILKDRAQRDEGSIVRAAAAEELAHGWHDDPLTVGIVKSLAQVDEDWMVRGTAIQVLVYGWHIDPQTLTIVKDRAQHDEDELVRSVAIHALLSHWQNDPQTLTIVGDRAQRDENEYVREVAVQELARGWRDDPQTLSILQDRAQRDKNSDVRQAAVRELARGWPDDPEVQAFLESLKA